MSLADIKVEYIIEYFLIFFIAFFGSFAKDYLRILKCGNGKVSIASIFLSTITASLLVFATSSIIQEHIGGIRGLMLCSFIGGLLGFSTLEKLSTIEGLLEFFKDFISFVRLRG